MHDSVDVPEPPVTVAGVTVQVRLVEFDVTTRVIVAENPFTGVTVNATAPAELAILVTAVGLTPIAKS